MLNLNENAQHEYKPSGGGGTQTGYRVEARSAFISPEVVLGKYNLGKEWQTINFDESLTGIGVPTRRFFEHGLYLADLLSYPAAEALRWWFHAAASNGLGGTCIETRIVAYECKYEWTCTAKSAHKLVGFDDRSSCIPDWGAKENGNGT